VEKRDLFIKKGCHGGIGGYFNCTKLNFFGRNCLDVYYETREGLGLPLLVQLISNPHNPHNPHSHHSPHPCCILRWPARRHQPPHHPSQAQRPHRWACHTHRTSSVPFALDTFLGTINVCETSQSLPEANPEVQ